MRFFFDGQILKRQLNDMLKYFCYAFTITIVLNGVAAQTSGEEWIIHGQDLWRIMVVCMFAVLPLLPLAFIAVKSVRNVIIVRVVHLAITAIFVAVPLIIFDALHNFLNAIIIFAIVAGVTYAIAYFNDRTNTADLNKKLSAFHNEENATHRD